MLGLGRLDGLDCVRFGYMKLGYVRLVYGYVSLRKARLGCISLLRSRKATIL
jgi:hypothetical protein